MEAILVLLVWIVNHSFVRLNPCCSGSYSSTLHKAAIVDSLYNVLILVVVEAILVQLKILYNNNAE